MTKTQLFWLRVVVAMLFGGFISVIGQALEISNWIIFPICFAIGWFMDKIIPDPK